MESQGQVVELLKRIEDNQLRSLAMQEQQLDYTKSQLDRSETSIAESIALQRVAIARQAQMRNIALPLIVVLMVLLGYLLVRWRIF